MRGENDSVKIVTHRTCFTANVITVIVIYVVDLVFIYLFIKRKLNKHII